MLESQFSRYHVMLFLGLHHCFGGMREGTITLFFCFLVFVCFCTFSVWKCVDSTYLFDSLVILGWKLLSLWILKEFFHCFLWHRLIKLEPSLYVTWFVSLEFYRIFSLIPELHSFYYSVLCCDSLCQPLCWSLFSNSCEFS